MTQRPDDGRAIDFVVESDRAQLSEIVQRLRDGRRRTNIGNVSILDEAVAARPALKACTVQDLWASGGAESLR